jgi:hypothetical protein
VVGIFPAVPFFWVKSELEMCCVSMGEDLKVGREGDGVDGVTRCWEGGESGTGGGGFCVVWCGRAGWIGLSSAETASMGRFMAGSRVKGKAGEGAGIQMPFSFLASWYGWCVG